MEPSGICATLGVLPNVTKCGCFLNNMLKALATKEADMVRPTKEQHPLFPEKWEGTIDRAQFLKKASTQTTSMMFAVECDCRRD